jgi:orotate phosphoribosyltransferase-like protein
MARRHKLDKYEEAKREAIKLYEKGKTLKEIANEISIKYVEVSKDSIHRLIKKYRELLKLKELGFLDDEDIDLAIHSQNLSTIAVGLIYEALAEFHEKGEISKEKFETLLDLLLATNNLAKTTANIEKTKTQLTRFYEKLFEKITNIINKNIRDDETKEKLLKEIQNELQN